MKKRIFPQLLNGCLYSILTLLILFAVFKFIYNYGDIFPPKILVVDFIKDNNKNKELFQYHNNNIVLYKGKNIKYSSNDLHFLKLKLHTKNSGNFTLYFCPKKKCFIFITSPPIFYIFEDKENDTILLKYLKDNWSEYCFNVEVLRNFDYLNDKD